MIQRHRSALLPLLFVVVLASVGLSRPAQAGLSDAALSLAGPLAEQFGVPASAVTALLDSGISLESATQLLLVSKNSGSGLDSVTNLFRESGNDISKTAEKLDVDAGDYSEERVTAAIDAAKRKAQDDTVEKAKDGASDALGSALDGLKR